MLGADGDLQRLCRKVDAVAAVQLDGSGVHVLQPLDWGSPQAIRVFQVLSCFRRQTTGIKIEVGLAGGRIAPEIQPDPPSAQNGLLIHQKVHKRGTMVGCLAGVERPLITFQEAGVQQLLGVVEILVEKFFFVASIRLGGDIPGQHLLVGARQIPPELDGSDAVLPFGQVLSGSSCPQCHAGAACLTGGIDRGFIQTRFAAGGVDDVLRQNDQIRIRRVLHGLFPVQCHGTTDALSGFVGIGQKLDQLVAIQHWDMVAIHFPPQGFGHEFGGQRSRRGPALVGIVVGLVAYIFTVAVAGERDPQIDQMVEAAAGKSSLRQSSIAVHRLPGKEDVCHLPDTVRVAAAGSQLIVGLFVGPGVPGSAHRAALCQKCDVVLSLFVKSRCCIQPCCAAADDQRLY